MLTLTEVGQVVLVQIGGMFLVRIIDWCSVWLNILALFVNFESFEKAL